MKIVLDTNTLIDAAQDDLSYPNKIIDEVLVGNLEAYANRGTRRENKLLVNQVMRDEEYKEKLEDYFDKLIEVRPVRLNVIKDDPEDNKILASAVVAGAEYLITADKHLLNIEEFDGVKIVEPVVFWNRYQEQEGNQWQDFVNQFLK